MNEAFLVKAGMDFKLEDISALGMDVPLVRRYFQKNSDNISKISADICSVLTDISLLLWCQSPQKIISLIFFRLHSSLNQ